MIHFQNCKNAMRFGRFAGGACEATCWILDARAVRPSNGTLLSRATCRGLCPVLLDGGGFEGSTGDWWPVFKWPSFTFATSFLKWVSLNWINREYYLAEASGSRTRYRIDNKGKAFRINRSFRSKP